MKVKLIRAARIRHKAGEIVEVSPAEAGFLLSTNSAVQVFDTPEKPENPESMITAEMQETEEAKPETPEKKTRPKSTRGKK